MLSIKKFVDPESQTILEETPVKASEIKIGNTFRFAETPEAEALENPGILVFQRVSDTTGSEKTQQCSVQTLDGKSTRKIDADRLVVEHDTVIMVKGSKKKEVSKVIPADTESKT